MTLSASPIGADSLRRVLHVVFAGPAYRWVDRPDPVTRVRAWLALLDPWWTAITTQHPMLVHSLLIGAGFVVLALAAHATWTFARAFRHAPPSPAATAVNGSRRDPGWYHAEADRLARAGRFADAMQVDFVALILTLDAREVLRFHPAKTPGDYVREARVPAAARTDLGDLVRRLYAYAFGRSPCGPHEFDDWRARAVPDRYAPAD